MKLFIDHVVQWNLPVWEHCTCQEGGESIQQTPLRDCTLSGTWSCRVQLLWAIYLFVKLIGCPSSHRATLWGEGTLGWEGGVHIGVPAPALHPSPLEKRRLHFGVLGKIPTGGLVSGAGRHLQNLEKVPPPGGLNRFSCL